MERRQFIQAAATSAVGLALASQNANAADNKQTNKTVLGDGSAFLNELKPKPLTFDPRKLNGISEKMIQSHWENNYVGSVKALNSIKKNLVEASSNKDTPPFLYNGLKREHLLRTGSVVYHDFYFGNLGGAGTSSKDIQKTIAKDFGSFEAWESEFRKIGTGLGGGSGWVVLGYNLHLGQLENYWAWDHMHAPIATLPILVMDMYEHSYQIDYGAQAAKYIDSFFKNINWDEVQSRIELSRKIKWT